MFDENILFIYAEPETYWIETIVLDVILSLPPGLFGEMTPWDSIITQSPFIKQFSIQEALEKMSALRSEMRVQSEEIFPLDSNESEVNLKKFVRKAPLRIMLFGDKGAPISEIGDLLVKKFNTYIITPKELVVTQVKKRTRIGTWLYWNIMERRGIPIWVLNHLLKIELKKDKYTHRGFILSNWPIIPELNTEIDVPCAFIDEKDYEADHEYQDPANKYIGEKFGEEDDIALDGLSISNISSMSSLNSVYDYEEKFLKIVRGKSFINMDGNKEIVLSSCARKQLKLIQYLWCTPKFIIFLDKTPCSKEFTAIMDDLEKFCLLNSQENVIQVDCRIGIKDIYTSICNRFLYIPYKINYDCTAMNPTESSLLSLEELCNSDKMLPNYKWWISEFGRMCPVNLYFGRRRWCNSAYPVRYLRYLFLSHSSDDRKTFMEHPGKYMNVVPICRIAIIGPHRVGKSTLAKFLGGYFKADIYKTHILQAEADMNHPTQDEMKILEKELKRLESLRLRDFITHKQTKLEEWSVCVLNLVNEAMAEAFNNAVKGNKKPNAHFDLFSNKLAEQYFQSIHKRLTVTSGVSQLILESAIFNKSIKNISLCDFLKWLAIKPDPPFQHRQYVLDSAPLDLKFWKELLVNDELPDCVYFFRIPPVKKMLDIYSFTHNIDCINQNEIFEEILSKFKKWKDHLVCNKLVNIPNNMVTDTDTLSYLKYFIELRFTEAVDFSQKYYKLQAFFQENSVICINIDISSQTWTRTIVKAVSDYLMTYQVKPTALYNLYIQTNPFDGDNDDYNSEEYMGTVSSTSLINDTTESDRTRSPCLHYGSYQEWCPVLLKTNNCLLRGDLNYAAEYENKIYVMHSRNALQKFLEDPRIFINIRPVAPLPKIVILGLSLKAEIRFAESLATAFYIQKIPCMQLFTTFPHVGMDDEEFSIRNVKKKYNEIKENFLYELSLQLKNGGVVYGFPLIFEQFNDLLINKLYPECVFIFDDKEKIVLAVYRYLSRLNSLKHIASTAELSNTELKIDYRYHNLAPTGKNFESESLKQEIMNKARNILRPFFEEMSKTEEACLKLRIPIIRIPKYNKRPQIIDKCVNKINQNRSRAAYFEEVKLISMRDSELLLNSGYYWFSRFKYSCPVDVGRLVTVNHFEGMSKQESIYPCIYRDFIYFVNGKKNFKTFQNNPLDYINTCNPPQMNIPLRIAIYGPPKSGVTTICKSMCEDLGLRIISSKDFPTGTISDSDIITYLKIYKSSTPNGVILDNLELTPKLLVEAAKNNVDIHLVIILVPSFKKVLNNCFIQKKSVKNFPQIILTDIHKHFCEKQKSIRCIRKSIHTCLFNIHYLDADVNTWTIWKKVKHLIVKTTRSISGYKLKLLKNRCANVTCLNLFYETLAFQRSYNHFYCQVCLSLGKLNAFKYYYAKIGPDFYTNECQKLYNQPYGYFNNNIYKRFKFSKPFEYNGLIEALPTQKRYAMSMFQYKRIIYWTCSIHTIDFMMNAAQYDIDCDINKPLYIPFLVMGYIKKYVAYDGYCPVEYLAGTLVKGSIHLSVYYRKKVYLMANKENTIEFLSYPEKYRKINFDQCLQLDNRGNKTFYGLNEDQLLTTLYDLANARPKHFVLSAEQSATCYLALKLKTENTYSKSDDYWHTSLHAFNQDCKELDDRLNKYKERINPYIIFP